MDTLPKEIINEIKYFYQLPEIEIIDRSPKHGDFYFCVKYHLATTKLKMISRLDRGKYDKNDNTINKFVDDLNNNIDCHYNEYKYICSCEGDDEENFDIEVKGNNIKIYNDIGEINLIMEDKYRLIEAMERYRDMLETYI